MRAHKKTGWRASIAFAAGLLVFWGGSAPAVASESQQEARGAPLDAVSAITGSATFYCNSDRRRTVLSRCHHSYPDRPGVADMYAAASGALQRAIGPDWRGRYVRVSRAGHGFVTVRLIDACGRGCTSLIDLYADAMWKLGGSGRIPVTVSWGAPDKLPSTDTEGSYGFYRLGGPLVAS